MKIEFEITENQARTMVKDSLAVKFKNLFIVSIVFVVVAISAILFGYLIAKDREVIVTAYMIVGVAVVWLIKVVYTCCKVSKTYIKSFTALNPDGVQVICLEKQDDEFVFTDVKRQNIMRHKPTDIVDCKKHKSVIIVNLTYKQSLLLPNTADIESFFRSYIK